MLPMVSLQCSSKQNRAWMRSQCCLFVQRERTLCQRLCTRCTGKFNISAIFAGWWLVPREENPNMKRVKWVSHTNIHPISNCGGKASHMVLIEQEVSECFVRLPALWLMANSVLLSSSVSNQKHKHTWESRRVARRHCCIHVPAKKWQRYSNLFEQIPHKLQPQHAWFAFPDTEHNVLIDLLPTTKQLSFYDSCLVEFSPRRMFMKPASQGLLTTSASSFLH